MKITREIVEKVVFDYGYDDYANVVSHKDGSIEIKFLYADAQMDLIFAISGIVQDIINESGIAHSYADYAWVNFTKRYVNVIFKEETFQNA